MAPERSANFVTLGFVASAAGDKRLAREAYERAVALDPADAAAWNNLGCLDLEAGKPLLAKARFREALRLDPRGERAQRNLNLVLAAGAPARYRNWDGVLEELMRELRRGHAARTTLAALLVEAPVASRGLYSREAALSGAAVALALRTMGAAALVPLGFGAAAAGVAYLTQRRRLDATRARVRQRARRGPAASGMRCGAVGSMACSRGPARDLEIDLLIENLALELVQCEDE